MPSYGLSTVLDGSSPIKTCVCVYIHKAVMRPRYRNYVPSPTSFVYRRVCLDTTGCRSGVARQKVGELVLSCCSQVCTFGTVYRIHTLSLCDLDEIFLPGPPHSPKRAKTDFSLFRCRVHGRGVGWVPSFRTFRRMGVTLCLRKSVPSSSPSASHVSPGGQCTRGTMSMYPQVPCTGP